MPSETTLTPKKATTSKGFDVRLSRLEESLRDTDKWLGELDNDVAGLDGNQDWRWVELEEQEKWAVWWGVSWRAAVAYVALALIAAVILSQI